MTGWTWARRTWVLATLTTIFAIIVTNTISLAMTR